MGRPLKSQTQAKRTAAFTALASSNYSAQATLRAMLRAANLADLARRSGYDERSLSRIRDGDINPRFTTVADLAEAMGCAVVLRPVARQSSAPDQLDLFAAHTSD